MSEVKVIDLSAWNDDIKHELIKQAGIYAALLRVTEKGNKKDSMFDKHVSGLKTNGINLMGVYKFSYAMNINELREEANTAVAVLKNYPEFDGKIIFLDLEYEPQAKLGKATLAQFAKEFKAIIEKAGYRFGIYASTSWYDYNLDINDMPYEYWLASYPYSDNGDLANAERLRPHKANQVGWQYSSKFPIGTNRCDMSVFEKSYVDSILKSTAKTEEKKDEIPVEAKGEDNLNKVVITKDKAYDCLYQWLKSQVGYMEKASNAYLDDYTKNAGYNNYTKYWRDIKPEYQGQPYCACFVSWCFMKAFGKETATKIMKHWPFVYCPTLGSLHKLYVNPEVGDIVLFYKNGEFGHTGVVVGVNGDLFTTIEGNTNNGTAIVANGGMVCQKQYYNSNLPGTKFVRPDYSLVTSLSYPDGQSINGEAEKKSESSTTNNDYTSYPMIRQGSTGEYVRILQQKLAQLGYGIDVDSDFGSKTAEITRQFQKKNGLEVDAIVGQKTWRKIFELTESKVISSLPRTMTVIKTPGVIRKSAKKASKCLAKLPAGTKVEAISKKTNDENQVWVRIKTSDGTTGWVISDNLKG